MPTPPKNEAGAGPTAAAEATTSSTGTGTALQFVAQLENYVGDLKRELRAYGDPNVVGRNAEQLQTFFDNISRCELQIAHAMGIEWSPSRN